MELLQKLITIINNAKAQGARLNSKETQAIVEALKLISSDQEVMAKLTHLTYFSKNLNEQVANLSKRESEIFKLIGLGFSSREIGNLLQISEATVSTHRKNTIRKLQLSGAGQLQKISQQYVLDNLPN